MTLKTGSKAEGDDKGADTAVSTSDGVDASTLQDRYADLDLLSLDELRELASKHDVHPPADVEKANLITALRAHAANPDTTQG